MDRTHRITVCTSCRHEGCDHRPGGELIERLRAAVAAVGGAADAFAVEGVACMAGCRRPCTVAFHAAGKATYLFGDIDAGAEDIADLVAFARQYHALADGWCSSTTRPGKLRRATLARVPALAAGAGARP